MLYCIIITTWLGLTGNSDLCVPWVWGSCLILEIHSTYYRTLYTADTCLNWTELIIISALGCETPRVSDSSANKSQAGGMMLEANRIGHTTHWKAHAPSEGGLLLFDPSWLLLWENAGLVWLDNTPLFIRRHKFRFWCEISIFKI